MSLSDLYDELKIDIKAINIKINYLDSLNKAQDKYSTTSTPIDDTTRIIVCDFQKINKKLKNMTSICDTQLAKSALKRITIDISSEYKRFLSIKTNIYVLDIDSNRDLSLIFTQSDALINKELISAKKNKKISKHLCICL